MKEFKRNDKEKGGKIVGGQARILEGMAEFLKQYNGSDIRLKFRL